MTTITIFGNGNMGQAIGGVLARGGASIQYIGSADAQATIEGDIVVLAVPYPALKQIASGFAAQLAGKTVVDITNPLDFATFDALVVPADGSAAAELQALLPESRVLKAFNTTFAATLVSGTVGGSKTTVLVIVEGRWPQPHMNNAKARFACLYGKRSGRAEARELSDR